MILLSGTAFVFCWSTLSAGGCKASSRLEKNYIAELFYISLSIAPDRPEYSTHLSVLISIPNQNWKARVSAYEDLVKFFGCQDDKSAEFAKYMPYIKKIPIDSNVTAQEKGLSVVLSFVEKSPMSVVKLPVMC